MATEEQRSLTLLVGPFMAIALAAASLAVIACSPLTMFPEIRHACAIVGLAESHCRAGAETAGLATLGAFMLVIAATLWTMRRLNVVGIVPLSIPPAVSALFLAFCFALILAHTLSRALGPAYVYRMADLEHFSKFISLENLLWPLLLQLMLLERDWRFRVAIAAALMSIITLTIFRTVDLTILVFGFILPLAYSAWDAHRMHWVRPAVRYVGINAILVLIFGGAVVWYGVTDTQSRTVQGRPIVAVQSRPATVLATNAPRTSAKEAPTKSQANDATEKSKGAAGVSEGAALRGKNITLFGQRLAYPLYQAAIVAHLSKTMKVPSVFDEIEQKFRLSSAPNLNAFAYGVIYPASAFQGETTPQYYGEAKAYFGKAWLVWALGAPLLFVGARLILSMVGIESETLLSVQLWRSSFSGLITLLPALGLQLTCLFALTRFSNSSAHVWMKAPAVIRSAVGILLVAVSFTAAAQAWRILDEPSRQSLVQLSFVPGNGCTFDIKTVTDLPDRVNAVAAPGLRMKSHMVWYTNSLVDVVLPYGRAVEQNLPEVVRVVSSFQKCETRDSPPLVRINGSETAASFGFLPFNVLTLTVLLLSALMLARILFEEVRLSFPAKSKGYQH